MKNFGSKLSISEEDIPNQFVCKEIRVVFNFLPKYRTRANKGRSQLVAAPLTFQAKINSLWFFISLLCDNLMV